MADWNASLYLQFEDERTRPARDLLAQVRREDYARIVDLGCGPGNSTELLVERFHNAQIIGVDSSPNMLKQARERLPDRTFAEADLTTWRPEAGTNLLFANAVFQWVPDHVRVMAEMLERLPAGGVLAVQMPDNLDQPSHVLMRETAADGPWADKLKEAAKVRAPLPSPAAYYDALKPLCRRVDLWHTIYQHPLTGSKAIVEWLMSTGLRPFLAPLDEGEQANFLAAYEARIARAYPARVDGTSLLAFPRLFIVAVR